MLISSATETTAVSTVTGLPTALRTKVLNTSVKLTGKTTTGAIFTGSGVIVYADSGTTTLVTAKHNLYIFADKTDPPAWSQALVTSFQQGVTVSYDGSMQFNSPASRTAALSAVKPITPNSGAPWAYDVMILESTDASLALFAANNYIYDLSYDQGDLTFLLNTDQYLARNNQTFIQTGYGSNREKAENQAKTTMPTATPGTNISGNLQYRVTQPAASATITVYSELSTKGQYQQYVNAVQLSADPNNSSAPGDSGGPLFVTTTPERARRVFLIGVTTGADMATAQTPCPTPPALRVNNIATSLEYCYRNGHLGY